MAFKNISKFGGKNLAILNGQILKNRLDMIVNLHINVIH